MEAGVADHVLIVPLIARLSSMRGDGMARKKPQRSKKRGPRSARGPYGDEDSIDPTGDGQIVAQLGAVLARVTQELEDVQRTLKVQFTRIAELQAQIDSLRVARKNSN
jgi:hypothetical protein